MQWQDRFIAMLPALEKRARKVFRALPPFDRDDAIANCLADVAEELARLHQRDEVSKATPWTLLNYAIRHYGAGRIVGTKLNANDVGSRYAWRRNGVSCRSGDERAPDGSWREFLVADKRANPADLATARLDFRAWFQSLPALHRRIVDAWVDGMPGKEIAKLVGLTAGRISPLRKELRASYALFVADFV